MLLMVVSITLTTFGANKLTITGGEGHPGDEVTVSVSLENSDDVVVAELQIPLNDQLIYVEGSCTLNSERADGHQVTAGVKDGKLNIVVYTLDLKPLKGNVGELLTFKLNLKKEPQTYPLSATVLLGDASGNKFDASSVDGTVTIRAAKLSVQTPIVDYGHIPIRSTYTQDVVLQNVGNETLEVTAVNFTADEFSVSETSFNIGAGEMLYLSVAYAPVNRGTISETVTFVSNSVYGAKSASLKADPFSVNELYVGSASGISDEEVTISLTMNNMEPIVGVQCEFTLPEQLVYVPDSFKASQRAGGLTAISSITDGKLKLILYSFTRTEIIGNDGEIATFKVKLNGNTGWYGLTPENVVLSNATTENMTSATFGGYVEIYSPSINCNDELNLGDCAIIAEAKVKYTISNYGDAQLTINKVTFLADGYSIAEDLPINIEPWQSKEITVEYIPSVKGEYSTFMQIYCNDPQNRMKSVKLSGSIYEPNNISVVGQVTDNGYDVTVSLDNYTEIVALQMDVHWLEGMVTSQELFTIGERLKGLSYVVSPMEEGVYRIIVYSLNNSAITSGIGELFTLSFEKNISSSINDSEIVIDNIVLSSVGGENVSSQSELTYNVKISILGDINDDGEVNVTDIVALYSYILGNTAGIDETAVDINADGEVNVTDIVNLYSIILNSN